MTNWHIPVHAIDRNTFMAKPGGNKAKTVGIKKPSSPVPNKPVSTWNRKAFARELAVARAAMPVGESVTDELRRGGRY